MPVSDLRKLIIKRQKQFMHSVHGGFEDIDDIYEALDIYEWFYILSGLADPWSPSAHFKCICGTCKQKGGCYHSTGLSLLCDDSVVMPQEYYLHGIPAKRGRGRPSAGTAKKALEEGRVQEEAPVQRKKAPVKCIVHCVVHE